MLYRICTEDKNRKKIIEIVTNSYPGFTILQGIGYWHKQQEKCLVIEIVTPTVETNKIQTIVDEIRRANNQEAVLIQAIECNSTFWTKQSKFSYNK